MKKNMTIVDLFCGAGGLTLGFEQAGFKSILAMDLWDTAIDTFNNNREEKVGIKKDIVQTDKNFLAQYPIKNLCGVVGGPPCQGFSLAGKRRPDDERNNLYKDYFRVLGLLNPDFFVIENVVGILNFSNGLIKNDILTEADLLNYKVFSQILSASDFGVPQNRKRVFFVGIKKTIVENKNDFSFPGKLDYSVNSEEAISDLPLLDHFESKTKYRSEPLSSYQKLMRGNCKIVLNHEKTMHSQITKDLISYVPEGGGMKDIPLEKIGKRVYSSLLRRMDRKKPSNTIDTGHRTYFHYSENRILTVREAARIQSFPDNYVFLGSKADQYKQVGNAVPPLLGYALASQLMKYLYGDL